MDQYFLGVDIGGTKSHALITNQEGDVLGFGQSGGGNWGIVGWDGFRKALHNCVEMALHEADIPPKQITSAGFGVAEYDWTEDHEPISTIIDSLDLNAPYELVNDAIIGLLAGAEQGWGVAVVAGTGNNCRGRDQHGREGRVTGIGSPFGEYGGATEIVERAVQAISLAWTMRGPETQLSDSFIKAAKAHNLEDLLAGLARGRYQLSAEASHLVFQAAAKDDIVSQEIIKWAGRELGDLATGVIRQLSFENESFEVVLVGSTFDGSQVLVESMEEHIHQFAPRAHLKRLVSPPVVGGVLLAMEQVGVNPTEIRSSLIEKTFSLLLDKR